LTTEESGFAMTVSKPGGGRKLTIAEEAATLNRTYQCSMYRVPVETREEVFAACKDTSIPLVAISRTTERRGYKVGDTTLRHVRNGGCAGCTCLIEKGPHL
jgi:hypothetical protein